MKSFGLLFAVVCVGCGGSGGGDGAVPPVPGHCEDVSRLDTSHEPTENPVWYFNASHFDNFGTRWPDANVHVRFNLPVVNGSWDENWMPPAITDGVFAEVNGLIAANGGTMRLIVWDWNTDPNATIGIEVYDASLSPTLGHGIDTSVSWDNDTHEIAYASVSLGVFYDDSCKRALLKGGLLQAVGFAGYTSDGGVMDAETRNAVVTDIVKDAIAGLYAAPPGTVFAP